MNLNSTFWRLLIGLVCAAIALRVIWDLLQPVVPFLVAVAVGYGLLQLVRWHRERW